MEQQIKILGIAHEQDLPALKSVLDNERINCISAISTDENLIQNIVTLPFDGVVAYIPKLDGLDFRFMERLYMSRKDITTLLIYDDIDCETLENAMYCGITRTIPSDLSPDDICREVIKEISRSSSRKDQALIKRFDSRVISVYSAKGGAGKTTCAVNISAALAREKKLILLDLDLQFGDAATYLGVDKNDIKTIAELCDESNITPNTIKKYIVRTQYDMDILPAPSGPERALSVSGEKLETIVSMLRSDYDFVIIDLPSLIDKNSITMMSMSDTVYYIVNPETPALSNARTCLDTLSKYDLTRRIKAILSKSGSSFITGTDVKSTLDIEMVGDIPLDTRESIYACNMGIPVVINNTKSKMSEGFFKLVEDEFGIRQNDTKPKTGIFSRFSSIGR